MKHLLTLLVLICVLANRGSASEPLPDAFTKIKKRLAETAKTTPQEFDHALLKETKELLSTASDEKSKVELWLALRARFSKQIDPSFDKNDVPAINVAPRNGLSGIPPESVVDPKDRADYVKAIDENRAKAKRHLVQLELRKALADLDRRAPIWFGGDEPTLERRSARTVEVLKRYNVPDEISRSVSNPSGAGK